MIRAIATLNVEPATATAFEVAVAEARPIFLSAEGCHAMHLERVIENPGKYRLVVEWDSVEAHTVTFRSSPGFQQWRALAGPFFNEPPEAIHTELVVGPAT